MSDFPVDWLTIREPYDHGARSAALADRFVAAVGRGPRLLDLGCGTGSNLRYLAPRIAGPQQWHCLDHDPALLAAARSALAAWAGEQGWAIEQDGEGMILVQPGGEIAIGFARCNLARDPLPATGVAGLTGSALLDLTSAAWLETFAAACRDRPVLMALSFDGRLAFEPGAPEDTEIRRRFLAHQRKDKGFGPALGPDAAMYLADRLAARGYATSLEPSDWRLGPADHALLRTMLDGVIDAVREIAFDDTLRRWAARRRAQLASDDLRLTVGHVDLLALPLRLLR